MDDFSEPWETGEGDARLALNRILEMSNSAKTMLETYCPQIVEAADNFSEDVLFVPISSVGFDCALNEDLKYAIKPERISPTWVTVPFLYSLHRRTQGLITPS